jgi:hypothetical protein
MYHRKQAGARGYKAYISLNTPLPLAATPAPACFDQKVADWNEITKSAADSVLHPFQVRLGDGGVRVNLVQKTR